METRSIFEDEIAARMPTDGVIRLDLAELTFVDSTGIRAIVDVARRLESGYLEIVGASGAVAKVIEIADLSHVPSIRVSGQPSMT